MDIFVIGTAVQIEEAIFKEVFEINRFMAGS